MLYLLKIIAVPEEPRAEVFTSPSACVLVENNLLKASSVLPHVASQRQSIDLEAGRIQQTNQW